MNLDSLKEKAINAKKFADAPLQGPMLALPTIAAGNLIITELADAVLELLDQMHTSRYELVSQLAIATEALKVIAKYPTTMLSDAMVDAVIKPEIARQALAKIEGTK